MDSNDIKVIEVKGSKQLTISKERGVAAVGKSAYQIALDNGFVGTESDWLNSLKGDTGATGPAGPSGATAGKFTYIQGLPLLVWNINHNLGFYPSVTIVDSSGSVVIGEVNYIDINNLTVSFSAAFSGEAHLS